VSRASTASVNGAIIKIMPGGIAEIHVIAEEPDFVVIAKPAGVAVHGGPSVKGPTVTDWLLERYPEVRTVGDEPALRPGIVHRLDKDTSGAMIIARTQAAFETLKEFFKSRQVEKTYLVLVAGTPESLQGVIDAPIGRMIRNRTKRGTGAGITGARPAVTEYQVIEDFSKWSLVRASPKTGRMHQIRVHLASINHPVAGDKLYGGGRPSPPGLRRQFLHAASLAFSYPAGRRLQFDAPLTADLEAVLTGLRAAQARNVA